MCLMTATKFQEKLRVVCQYADTQTPAKFPSVAESSTKVPTPRRDQQPIAAPTTRPLMLIIIVPGYVVVGRSESVCLVQWLREGVSLSVPVTLPRHHHRHTCH
ncbi:hypothetical protein Pmani_037815 [Petrolisthes manimaculis]|uniref:Uncharacterized protein n=1 Tax=Petrolisthes manimaculis TaxID=1843537 RepID=A0AAE1TMY3_9EUCA|nr:hypothetical protein Pmani_037815 [Petrolisthes manimaculis]